jgi:hypothetical protein
MTPTQGGPFRVIHSGAVHRRVRAIVQRALERGIVEEVGDELNSIQERLSSDPLSWGDERGSELRYLGLAQRHKLLRIFCVRFAVDPVRRIVYVQDYIPTYSHAFLDPL